MDITKFIATKVPGNTRFWLNFTGVVLVFYFINLALLAMALWRQ